MRGPTPYLDIPAWFLYRPFTWRLPLITTVGKAMIKVLDDNGISKECVTEVTTDTAAERKEGTVYCTHMEGLPWFTYVIDLMIEILMKYI